MRLQKESELFRLICNELNMAVFEVDFTDKTIRFSESCKRYVLYDQQPGDILGDMAGGNFIHPEDQKKYRKFFTEIKGTQGHAEVTCRLLLKNGSYRWVRVTGLLYKNEDAQSSYAVGIIVDADREIQKKKENEHLLNDIPGGVGIFDIKNGVATQRYMNDAYYRMLSDCREERDERNERSFFNGVAKEDWPTLASAINSLIDGKQHVDFSYRALAKNGDTVWIRLEGNVAWRDDEHIVVYCSFSNVTEMYNRLESQLRRTSAALEAAKKANEEKNEFYSRMSHDMRTPMNGILGMAALSHEETDLEKLHYNAKMIEASGTYMLSLINDSLDMQRIENGKLTLIPQVFKADIFIENVISMVAPTAHQKGIQFSFENKNVDLEHYVKIDGVRFKQIFMNLLSNAIKFTQKGGRITTSMECLGHEGSLYTERFVIADNGVGMSENYLKNSIFRAYEQEPNEMTQHYAGSGLGLAITKSLVELMGGTITVDSVPNEGTTFTLVFQILCLTDEEVQSEEKKQMIERTEETPVLLEGRRVLVCEDHPLNAEIVIRLLKRKGILTDHAKNGREGLALFNNSPLGYYNAILMDIRMPVMNGLEAAVAIRHLSRPDAAQIPIIAVTANAYLEDIENAKAAGMDAHLSKPIDAKKLYHALSECMEKR